MLEGKIAGSIAGAIATVPMTAVMRAFDHPQELPPRVIAENAAGGAMQDLDEETRDKISMTAHFSFGAAAGAGYGALAGQTGLPPAAEGALYGIALWGGSYLGVMPAAGLYQPATEDKASRTLMMIGAHVVWGATLGLVWQALSSFRHDK